MHVYARPRPSCLSLGALSDLSHVVSIWMKKWTKEKKAFRKTRKWYTYAPKICWWCWCFPNSEYDAHTSHIKIYISHLKKQVNNQFPFLDVILTNNVSRFFNHSFVKKNTSDSFTNYRSLIPVLYKTGSDKISSRAFTISSTWFVFGAIVNKTKKCLRKNVFTCFFIYKKTENVLGQTSEGKV